MIYQFLSRTDPPTIGRRTRAMFVLAGAMCLATGALVWFGWLATARWRRSADLLEQRRAEERLQLFLAALNRDMKGAHVSVLSSFSHEQLTSQAPYELADLFARAFARFPYPESFFVWRRTDQPMGVTYFFNRSDRSPIWWKAKQSKLHYPVVTVRNPEGLSSVVEQARHQATARKRFAVFETILAGQPYQVVVHLLYDAHTADGTVGGGWQLFGLVGYMVNLHWVRDGYFTEIASQVASLGGGDDDLVLGILDHDGVSVTVGDSVPGLGVERAREFPLLFFEPALVSREVTRTTVEKWTARVQSTVNGSIVSTSAGSKRLFAIIACAAAVSVICLLATWRAVLVTAEFASMKSEFVSTVTHELKTPLSLIRLVGETLAMGRYSSAQTIKDYSEIISQETARLTLLIDNLLAYARLNEAARTYHIEKLDIIGLAEEVVERYQPRLAELGFQVSVDAPPDLPQVRGDRAALTQVFENVLDNAIKYSPDERLIDMRAETREGGVLVQVSDHGTGIPEEELTKVFDKFFRGRHAMVGGSGLGLAITKRIIEDHAGTISLRSEEGKGTTVTLTLPKARKSLGAS